MVPRLLARLADDAGSAGAVGEWPASRLGYQESQVLAMSADGLTQTEIAAKLDITPASMRTHSLRARRKLGAATLTQAVVTWLRQLGRLTTGKGSPEGRLHSADATVAKNYLSEEELDHLNQLVSGFLDAAELRVRNHQTTTMAQCVELCSQYIMFTGGQPLQDRGR